MSEKILTLNPLECALNEAQALRMQVNALQAENAKLRELCKEWYRFAREIFDEYVGEPESDEDFMTLEDRLRRMGVEPY